MRAENVSCLISTYRGETAGNLAAALASIYGQTPPPGEVVIVVDGPVDADQHDVIARFSVDRRVSATKVVALDRQHGLAGALNAGLDHCGGEYVMRMDSDDLTDTERLRYQLAYAEANPAVDLIGSWATEFSGSDHRAIALKASPTDHDQIIRALKWRNILCHPSILVRRQALTAIGGYRTTFGKLEDYDLFVRLALGGARFHVIPRALVHVRVSMDQRLRRGGLRHLMHDLRFRAECRRAGFLSWPEFVVSGAAYLVFRLVPGRVRDLLYRTVRSQAQGGPPRLDGAKLDGAK